MFITSTITDRIGLKEILLPINPDHFNFRKKQIHLEQISSVETMTSVKNFSILEIALIFFRYDVVAMVTVINSMIGGFSWVDLV